MNESTGTPSPLSQERQELLAPKLAPLLEDFSKLSELEPSLDASEPVTTDWLVRSARRDRR
jgi:hypothetical protein